MLGEVESGDPGGADPVPDSNGAGPGVRIHSKESDQAHIAMGVPSYPLTHPDRYALQLVGTVLGTGMSSRLFTEVRERRGLAYYVFATNHSYTDTGTLYSQAGVDINRIDEAIETIARELKKIAAEPVPAEELEKSKNVAKGRFVLATESPHGMITFGLRREVLEGQVEEPEDVLAGNRRRHGRGRPACRAGRDRPERAEARADRAVRRRGALREDPRGLSTEISASVVV